MKSLLLQLTGEHPLFKIVDFLIDNKGLDLTKKDIIEGANISRASLFNYWPELEKYNIVRVTRKFGKTKLFVLNVKSPITQRILELEKTLIQNTMEQAQKKPLMIPASSHKKSIALKN